MGRHILFPYHQMELLLFQFPLLFSFFSFTLHLFESEISGVDLIPLWWLFLVLKQPSPLACPLFTFATSDQTFHNVTRHNPQVLTPKQTYTSRRYRYLTIKLLTVQYFTTWYLVANSFFRPELVDFTVADPEIGRGQNIFPRFCLSRKTESGKWSEPISAGVQDKL